MLLRAPRGACSAGAILGSPAGHDGWHREAFHLRATRPAAAAAIVAPASEPVADADLPVETAEAAETEIDTTAKVEDLKTAVPAKGKKAAANAAPKAVAKPAAKAVGKESAKPAVKAPPSKSAQKNPASNLIRSVTSGGRRPAGGTSCAKAKTGAGAPKPRRAFDESTIAGPRARITARS